MFYKKGSTINVGASSLTTTLIVEPIYYKIVKIKVGSPINKKIKLISRDSMIVNPLNPKRISASFSGEISVEYSF